MCTAISFINKDTLSSSFKFICNWFPSVARFLWLQLQILYIWKESTALFCSWSIRKSGDSYPLPFKKEVNSLNSLHLFSSSNSHNFISDPHNADTKRPENEKDHKRVAVKRVAKASKKESSAGEDLDSYPDFLHKMTVVVLQKLHSDKKDSYETEDDSSWDNVELGDYTTQAMEEEAYSDLSQEHVNLLPLFKSKIEGQGPGDSAALSYDRSIL